MDWRSNQVTKGKRSGANGLPGVFHTVIVMNKVHVRKTNFCPCASFRVLLKMIILTLKVMRNFILTAFSMLKRASSRPN